MVVPDACVFCLMFVFFQAEDGIRDLVRSRGLGDVYKRQRLHRTQLLDQLSDSGRAQHERTAQRRLRNALTRPVSYTHLTLPTSDLV